MGANPAASRISPKELVGNEGGCQRRLVHQRYPSHPKMEPRAQPLRLPLRLPAPGLSACEGDASCWFFRPSS